MSQLSVKTDQEIEGKKLNFYAVAWRWHFYIGLLVTPIMIMLSITGIVYLFKPQLDPIMYPKLFVVAPTGHTQSADRMVEVLKNNYHNAQIKSFNPALDERSSAKFMLKDGDDTINVFMNPYTSEVLGVLNENSHLQAIMMKLHGELLIGDIGDRIIELAVSWALVLMITGIYLWWPRGGGVTLFWPRWNTKGRKFWRDFHASTGFWSALFFIVILFSGLTWTGYWGEQFAAVWSRFPEKMWNDVPKSDKKAIVLNTTSEKIVPWAIEQTALPKSDEHAHHNMNEANPNNASIGLQQAIDVINKQGIVAGYKVAYPKGADGVFTASVFPKDPKDETTIHVDQYTGKVLADIRFKDYHIVPKIVEYGIVLHKGIYFGLANQLMMLAISLLMLACCISGIIMWWKRRPLNSLGAPASPKSQRIWKTAFLIMVFLGIAFPLVGLSFIAIMLFDWLVVKQIPYIRNKLH